MAFQYFPHTNVWGRKLDLAVKRVSKTDFQDGGYGGHLRIPIDTNLAYFDQEIVVWEEMSKIDIKDGGCGGHLGF